MMLALICVLLALILLALVLERKTFWSIMKLTVLFALLFYFYTLGK